MRACRNEPFTHRLIDLVEPYQPEIRRPGTTTQGRDPVDSVATTLKTGLTVDCAGLAIDPDHRSLLSSRPTFAAGLMCCTIVIRDYRPQMATVHPRLMATPARDPSHRGPIVERLLGMAKPAIITKILEFIPDERQHKPQLALPIECRKLSAFAH